ncbi:hypothetical protein I316_02304 [Kwoniella heveanensis BCC8398]|uniref:Uncharacterized protein n=1 Tax=Kwoniella heveanensis BCC8398 TaxID=1296120 RepID=A0A1B9GXQ1_9TREE|nr:hypothetical protein I316_02304 [Kwoniella heveanensis BCC8398]
MSAEQAQKPVAVEDRDPEGDYNDADAANDAGNGADENLSAPVSATKTEAAAPAEGAANDLDDEDVDDDDGEDEDEDEEDEGEGDEDDDEEDYDEEDYDEEDDDGEDGAGDGVDHKKVLSDFYNNEQVDDEDDDEEGDEEDDDDEFDPSAADADADVTAGGKRKAAEQVVEGDNKKVKA